MTKEDEIRTCDGFVSADGSLLGLIQGADVEWKPLGEVCEIADTARKPVKSDQRVSGNIPYYGANNIQDYVDGFTHDGEYVLIAEDGSASLEHYSIQFAIGKFWANNHVHVVKGNDELNSRFLFHYLSQFNFQKYLTGGTRAKLTKQQMLNIPIPIPSLEIQQKVVEILDKMTDYVTELTAELTLRQKQYSYYRDQLLTFPSQSDSDESLTVRWTTLGEIGEVTKLAGFEFTKYVEYSDTGNIIALRGLNIKGRLDLTDVKYIDDSDFSKLNRSKLFVGDMMFTYVGTVGQVALIDENDRYYLAPNVARIRFDKNQTLPEFMRYYFSSNLIKKQIDRFMQSSSMKNLTMENIRKFDLPVPPLNLQSKIVEILDKFQALTEDVSGLLPEEIALRQKQYAYYREQLLTFTVNSGKASQPASQPAIN